jgi:hypothetical protein
MNWAELQPYKYFLFSRSDAVKNNFDHMSGITVLGGSVLITLSGDIDTRKAPRGCW